MGMGSCPPRYMRHDNVQKNFTYWVITIEKAIKAHSLEWLRECVCI